MSVELAVLPPLFARYADSRSADAPSPVHSVDGGAAEAAVPVLRLTDIDLSPGGIQTLSGIDLTVVPGETRAIIGPNGVGKSSPVNIINGLYRPDCGSIWLNGRTMRKVSPASLVELGIARIFQNPALFKGLRVRDNVALGRVQHTRSVFIEQLIGLGRARHELANARERAEQVIHFVGLTEVQDQLAGTLPYGPQKCVGLACALVTRPRLSLLDESPAGTTVTEKVQMVDLIRVACDQWDTTIALTEHDIGLVLGLSDRVAVLDYDRKAVDGTPQAVRDNLAVTDAYLDVAHATADAAETQWWTILT